MHITPRTGSKINRHSNQQTNIAEGPTQAAAPGVQLQSEPAPRGASRARRRRWRDSAGWRRQRVRERDGEAGHQLGEASLPRPRGGPWNAAAVLNAAGRQVASLHRPAVPISGIAMALGVPVILLHL